MAGLQIPWFKYEITHEIDARFLAISRLLNMRLGLVSDFWTKLMVAARKSSTPGTIEDFSYENIRMSTDLTDDEIQSLLDAFIVRKIVTVYNSEDCITVVMSGWEQNQGVTDNAKAVRECRARKKAAEEGKHSDTIQTVPNVDEILESQTDSNEDAEASKPENPKKSKKHENKYKLNYSPSVIEQAEQIYDYYDSTIQPSEKHKNKVVSAITNICKRMTKTKLSYKDTMIAINNYNTEKPEDIEYRYAASNFFSFNDKKKYIENYLPEFFQKTSKNVQKTPSEWLEWLSDEEWKELTLEEFGIPHPSRDVTCEFFTLKMKKEPNFKFPEKFKILAMNRMKEKSLEITYG